MRLLNTIRNIKNWPAYYAHKIFNKGKGFTFSTPAGVIEVPARLMHTFKEIYFDSSYLSHLPAHITNKEQPVVIDIGANVGYFSLFALGKLDRPLVYSYEPIPANFMQMKKYATQIGANSWHPENKAVAGKPGFLELHYDASDSFTTSASLFEKSGEKDVLKVECETLESLMKNFGLDSIDILKLDCEGAEYEILYQASDAVLNKIHSITMETHQGKSPSESKVALEQYLTAKGFQIYTNSGDLLWAWK